MENEIPIEEQVFTPNPLLVADLIFDSPKPAKTTAFVQRRGSEAAMEYTRHPSDASQHVHFDDGKTTRMKSYQYDTAMAGPPPPQQFPQQPQAAYPLQQTQQQQPLQQQAYFPPPPQQGAPKDTSSPMPIPGMRDRQGSMVSNRSPSYQSAQGPYGSSPNYARQYPSPQAPQQTQAVPPQAAPPQAAFGQWPHQGYFLPQPGPPPNGEVSWQQPGAPRNPSVSYLPGPGAPMPGRFYGMPPPERDRNGSSSSYASRSSYRSNHRDWDRDSPITESDEDSDSSSDDEPRRRRHSYSGSSKRRHHGHSRKSSFHGDKASSKYSGANDHASLGDTLALIWDGLSGFGKPKRY